MLFRSNDTATTEIYTGWFTLSLHDALPIFHRQRRGADYEQTSNWLTDESRLDAVRAFVGNVVVGERFSFNALRDRLRAVADERKWSASTWNKHQALLSLAFRLGRKEGLLPPSVVFDLEHRQENNERVRWLNPEEYKRLRGVIQEQYSYFLPRFDLGVNTGLRLGNLMRLRWDMVDWFAEPQAALRVPVTKNGASVNIPLNAAAQAALAAQRERTGGKGFVFGHRSEDFKFVNGSQKWFREACKKAGIENFTWHDLRHHFASIARQKGADLPDIAQLLGHKGLSMTKRYAHQSMANLADVVNKVGGQPQPMDTKTDTTPTASSADGAQVTVKYGPEAQGVR